MGRRSVHTADQLRDVILEASRAIIAEHGLQALSAREIARRIEYSPGTLYNIFENLDDIILTIEGQMLDRLLETVTALPSTTDARLRVRQLAHAYLQFSHDNPKLWNLLFEHHLPAGTETPPWYRAKLNAAMAQVEAAVAPLIPSASPEQLRRNASVLWAGVHGISSLSTADKLANVSQHSAAQMIDDLVGLYLTGLAAEAARQTKAD
jgi:AcrR family transcriptional regulator